MRSFASFLPAHEREANFLERWKSKTSRGYAVRPVNSWPKRIVLDISEASIVDAVLMFTNEDDEEQ